MTENLRQFCLPPDAALRQALACLNDNRRGIVLVTDPERRLLGTITDGDLRRAFLEGLDLDQPVSRVLATKQSSPYSKPITAPLDSDPAYLLRLMRQHGIRQIPLLDPEGGVADLASLDSLVAELELPLKAVIMAGGYGTRLRPMTENLPKPMLPVGDKPLLEHTLGQLKRAGIRQVSLATHYLGEKIAEHFGDGHGLGVEISYLCEDQPLGTAGALGLLEETQEPLLIINGDILTTVDFRAMLDYHRQHRAAITVAVRKYDLAVPYGVVETEGGLVRGLTEKPVYNFFVNAGIYLLEPGGLCQLEPGQRMDMTDLVERLLTAGQTVASFPIIEYWLDIGTPGDYQRAIDDYQNGRI